MLGDKFVAVGREVNVNGKGYFVTVPVEITESDELSKELLHT